MKDWQKENCYYFGRHEHYEPVNVWCGYRYNAATNGNVYPSVWDAVIRAIPAEGTVERASWKQSPQARFWLDPEPKTIWERFRAWLDK